MAGRGEAVGGVAARGTEVAGEGTVNILVNFLQTPVLVISIDEVYWLQCLWF